MDNRDTDVTLVLQDCETVNPFYHRICLSAADKLRVAVFTVLLLPLRIIGLAICLTICWLLGIIGTWGVPEKDLMLTPLTGRRRNIGKYLSFFGRLGFRIFGLRVTIKGRQASREEAPVLIVAPHSSFADLAIGLWMGLPHLICRSEEKSSFLIGSIMNYSQPIYVARDDPNSRQNTLKEMIRRATSTAMEWRQIMVFPEGTCSNRKALLAFKPGGFYPAVPVQPVCLHYIDDVDTVSWTWDGPGALTILWLTMTRLNTNLIIEFLPPVVPNEKERLDPNLFAENTQHQMSRRLGIPISNYSFDDGQMVAKAKELELPSRVGLVGARAVKIEHSINQKILKDEILVNFAKVANREYGLMTLPTLAKHLGLDENDASLLNLFCFFDKEFKGYVTFKQYVPSHLEIVRTVATDENLTVLYKVLKVCSQPNDVHRMESAGVDFSSLESFKKSVTSQPQLLKYLQLKYCKLQPQLPQLC